MASRANPKPGRHNSESNGGLSLCCCGALEAWLSFEGHRRCGWVCPRVGDLPDHPPARTSCRSNLANHILVFFFHTHARSGPQTLAPLRRQQRTTESMAIWFIASSIPRTGASPGCTTPGPYLRISHPIYIITRDPTDHPRCSVDTRVHGVLNPQPICWRESRATATFHL